MNTTFERAAYATPEQSVQTIPSIDWWVTSRCNLACDFCYGPVPTRDPDTELRENIARTLVESPADTITFCGGEPLVYGEEVFRYARMFQAAGKRVVLNTNGELLERAMMQFRRPGEDLPFDVVGLSIEGPTQETHARMRAGADLAATFRAGRLVSAYGKSLKVATVVSQVNKAWLPQLANFIRYELDPEVWRLYQYNPNGPYNRGQGRHTLSKEQYREAIGRAASFAHTMPTYPSDNESQNCLIVDPEGKLSLSDSSGYEALGDCLREPIGTIWGRKPSTTHDMVTNNKRWIGATILKEVRYPQYNHATEWYDWTPVPVTEEASLHLQNVAELQTMQKIVAGRPENFQKACMDSLPESLPNGHKERHWQEALKQIMGCDTSDPVATMKAVDRFTHYYFKNRYEL
jgi:MoaA/NifB/PqqE/SkfB family radical SAM enzyme